MSNSLHEQYEELRASLLEVATAIVEQDLRVHSVGIVYTGEMYVYAAVRNTRWPVLHAAAQLDEVVGTPVVYKDAKNEPHLSHIVSINQLQSSVPPEQRRQRPLQMGLRVHNYDHNVRSGRTGQGSLSVGTLSCFVRRRNKTLLLGNNHVLADFNRARPGDRVFQPGVDINDEVATLVDYEPLEFTDQRISSLSDVVFNKVDVAFAELFESAEFANSFLPQRSLPALSTWRQPGANEQVFKVGQTSEVTQGTIYQRAAVFGPITNEQGNLYFNDVFTVQSNNARQFSSPGDSGAAVIAKDDNSLLGIVLGSDGTYTYVCSMEEIVKVKGGVTFPP